MSDPLKDFASENPVKLGKPLENGLANGLTRFGGAWRLVRAVNQRLCCSSDRKWFLVIVNDDEFKGTEFYRVFTTTTTTGPFVLSVLLFFFCRVSTAEQINVPVTG